MAQPEDTAASAKHYRPYAAAPIPSKGSAQSDNSHLPHLTQLSFSSVEPLMVLLVSTNHSLCVRFAETLTAQGYTVRTTDSTTRAVTLAATEPILLVLWHTTQASAYGGWEQYEWLLKRIDQPVLAIADTPAEQTVEALNLAMQCMVRHYPGWLDRFSCAA